MADLIASLFLIILLVVSAGFYVAWRWTSRKRRDERDLAEGMALIGRGHLEELTERQGQLCREFLYNRFAAMGGEHTKGLLEQLEQLRFERERDQ